MYSKDKITIVDRREMLKVKVKSLALEAQIIRKEERRTHGELRAELHTHRVDVVRSEARHSCVAYGLIKGRRYEQMEVKPAKPIDWARVNKMLRRYGPAGMVAADLKAA